MRVLWIVKKRTPFRKYRYACTVYICTVYFSTSAQNTSVICAVFICKSSFFPALDHKKLLCFLVWASLSFRSDLISRNVLMERCFSLPLLFAFLFAGLFPFPTLTQLCREWFMSMFQRYADISGYFPKVTGKHILIWGCSLFQRIVFIWIGVEAWPLNKFIQKKLWNGKSFIHEGISRFHVYELNEMTAKISRHLVLVWFLHSILRYPF